MVNTVGLAIELSEWKDMTPDEKMQREPDINHVVNEICHTLLRIRVDFLEV